MAVSAVVFDFGETLVEESVAWERAADAGGVPRFTGMGVVGGLAARGDPHARVWELLRVDPPRWVPAPGELYPDTLPCFDRLRRAGYLVGAAGNMPAVVEPALAAGMVGVHIRRGPWGHLHEPPPEAIRIRSLDELPAAVDG